MKRSSFIKKNKGVALIISVGILALIAMIATSFAINMQLEYRAASNFYDYSLASEIAEGATQVAIADIRNWAQTVDYNTVLNNVATNYSSSSPEVVIAGTSNTYQITVQREEATADGTKQLININTLDETDYPWIDRLYAAGLSYDDIAKIIDYRGDSPTSTTFLLTSGAKGAGAGLWVQSCNSGGVNVKHGPYATIEEVRLVLNDNTKYNDIKDIITVTSPIMRGGMIGKYYSERTGWDPNTVLNLVNFRGKVVELGRRCQSWGPGNTFPGTDGPNSGWSEAHDAEWQGAYIAVDWGQSSGFDQFGVVFTGYLYIPQANVGQNINFWVTSRNGANFYIDGNQITSYWSTVNANTEETGNVTFTRAGWHPIRFEFYNEINENVLYLDWDLPGYKTYVPAENLGYRPTSFYGKIYNYYTKRFIMEDGLSPTTTGIQYNQAGVFRITATAKVKRSDGTVLAQKQIASTVRVFGTWTQTTRPEFSAAWFTDYYFPGNSSGGAGFAAGQIRNVNWMDSCPTDEDSFDVTTNKMHWEGNYATTPDSLKLGLWCNFDEDMGYNVIMFKGDVDTFQNPQDTWTNSLWNSCSFTEVASSEGAVNSYGNNSYCLKLIARGNNPSAGTTPEEKTAAVNGYYYYPVPDQSGNCDMFVRSYLQDKGQYVKNGSWSFADSWRYESQNPPPPPTTTASPPAAPFCATWLIPKGLPYSGTFIFPSYYSLLKNQDGIFFALPSVHELNVGGTQYSTGMQEPASPTYPMDTAIGEPNPYVMAEMWQGSSLRAFHYSKVTSNNAVTDANFVAAGTCNSVPSNLATDSSSPPVPYIVKFKCHNTYSYTGWGSAFLTQIAAANGYTWGCNSDLVSIIDDVRIIYPSGFLASTPFVAKSSDDNSNITWGTVTWTSVEPAGTSVTIGLRAADTLSADDVNWQTETKGASLSGFSGRNIQYKATLATTNLATSSLDVNGYSTASSTPVFKNITVTYLPPVQFLYRK